MPQLYGSEEIGLISQANLWVEAVSERDIEKATHPEVAAEARARGLVPLRMGTDPIWHHPPTGQIASLTPAHAGDSANYSTIRNVIGNLRRKFPTPEETARASRTPEDIDADRNAAAAETRTKKQQGIDAAKRKKEQEEAVAFKKNHAPFRNVNDVQQAFDRRSPQAKLSRPGDTVEQFAQRLRNLTTVDREKVHRSVFPERYS